MSSQSYPRRLLVGGILLFLVVAAYYLNRQQSAATSRTIQPIEGLLGKDFGHGNVVVTPPPTHQETDVGKDETSTTGAGETHRVLYSRSTIDRKYFNINSRDYEIYNPSFIPHPVRNFTWIVTGQKKLDRLSQYFSELHCEAMFLNNELFCLKSPLTLSIAATSAEKCKGRFAAISSWIGAHDARVFYSPDFPIVTYGSTSAYTCLGQFATDLRTLMDWEYEPFDREQFRFATELQRPPPIAPLEKNWFLWWDSNGRMYAHYNIEPRTFASIAWNGSAGPNLAGDVAAHDAKCIAKYVPRTRSNAEHETIHQSTNSLAVTLCKRHDPSCTPQKSNTYVVSIFHHRIRQAYHNVYEPYVMVMQQDAPFSLFGFSTKPLWIHGRQRPGERDDPSQDLDRPDDESEMFYVTSISWKTHGQRYHGYIDDEIFLAFGIEDSRSGGIDVLASDLLQDLGFCGHADEPVP